MSPTPDSVHRSGPGETSDHGNSWGDEWGNEINDGSHAVDETDDAVESAPGDIGEGPDTRESLVQ